MKLRDLAIIQLGLRDADFWLERRGGDVGKPTKEFEPTRIGIKVTRTNIMVPQYLYYLLTHFWHQGMWKDGITVLDVKNLTFKTSDP
jgi:hypothetical protein